MAEEQYIRLAHGGGGQLTGELLEQVILPALGSPQKVGRLTDAATIATKTDKLALTTDNYVIQPLEFPGGDIGKLAVCGTINDLAVVGAEPKALSLALVLEEGLEIKLLRRVLRSAGEAAAKAGVPIVTGDTKVVEPGGVDGMVINTTGVGELKAGAHLGFEKVSDGDEIVLSGPLGEHALAVMSQREGLSFSSELASDCAAIHSLTRALLDQLGPEVHFMRDPTRGGLAATLVEIATAVTRDIEVKEDSIPVNKTARAAAEMLGLDLLSAANEGKLLAVVHGGSGQRAVEILARYEIADRSAVIGRIAQSSQTPLVEMVTSIGGRRVIQMPYGEELPRIC